MRLTHYMHNFVDLESGKSIPSLVFFWRPMCNFSKTVLITIYSISWWWWLANRVCPASIFDLQILNLWRGFLLRLFCSEPLFDKFWWYFHTPGRRFLGSPGRGKSIRRPPSAVHHHPPSNPATSAAAVCPLPSPEPSIIHLTPDRPLLRLPTGNKSRPTIGRSSRNWQNWINHDS